MNTTTGDRSGRSEGIVVCTKPVCKHRDRDPKSGMWQPPPERSHTHFAEREQEPIPGISISRILGMGSHTKMPSMGYETRESEECVKICIGDRISGLGTALKRRGGLWNCRESEETEGGGRNP